MTVSWWRQYAMVTMDPALIQIILDLQREHFERWQIWPTVAQILTALQRSGGSLMMALAANALIR